MPLGYKFAMVAITLCPHHVVRHGTLHNVDPTHFGCALTHFTVVEQPMHHDEDLLQPPPSCAIDELRTDAIQLRRPR